MKNKWIRIGLILLIGLIAGVYNVYGQDSVPAYDELVPHVVGFEIPTGQYCVTDYRDGEAHTTCYCPCESDTCQITPDTPDTPDPTPEPTPEDKPACNRGLGNGSENCDPGNSGGKPGSAGEDNEGDN